MFKSLVTDFTFASLRNGTVFTLGIDIHDFIIVGVTVLIVFVIGILKEKDVSIRESIAGRNIAIRWAIYYALIIYIIIFGAYGRGYVPVDPIYANF